MEGFEDDIVYEVIFDDLGGALGMSLKRNEEGIIVVFSVKSSGQAASLGVRPQDFVWRVADMELGHEHITQSEWEGCCKLIRSSRPLTVQFHRHPDEDEVASVAAIDAARRHVRKLRERDERLVLLRQQEQERQEEQEEDEESDEGSSSEGDSGGKALRKYGSRKHRPTQRLRYYDSYFEQPPPDIVVAASDVALRKKKTQSSDMEDSGACASAGTGTGNSRSELPPISLPAKYGTANNPSSSNSSSNSSSSSSSSSSIETGIYAHILNRAHPLYALLTAANKTRLREMRERGVSAVEFDQAAAALLEEAQAGLHRQMRTRSRQRQRERTERVSEERERQLMDQEEKDERARVEAGEEAARVRMATLHSREAWERELMDTEEQFQRRVCRLERAAEAGARVRMSKEESQQRATARAIDDARKLEAQRAAAAAATAKKEEARRRRELAEKARVEKIRLARLKRLQTSQSKASQWLRLRGLEAAQEAACVARLAALADAQQEAFFELRDAGRQMLLAEERAREVRAKRQRQRRLETMAGLTAQGRRHAETRAARIDEYRMGASEPTTAAVVASMLAAAGEGGDTTMTEEIATSAARAGGDETSSKPTAKEPVGEYELARRWLHQRGRHGIIEDYERREDARILHIAMQIERKALADKNARQAAKRKTKEAEQRHLQSVQALKQKAEEQMLHKRHLKARAKLLGSNNDGSPGFKKLILYAAHDANRYGTGL